MEPGSSVGRPELWFGRSVLRGLWGQWRAATGSVTQPEVSASEVNTC